MKQGIDISSYQDGIETHLVSANLDFVYAKAAEGVTFKDPCYEKFRNAAHGAGIRFGAYHFFHFDQDPIAQANFFLDVANPLDSDLAPMVDVEVGPFSIGPLAAFNKQVENHLGRKVVIYTGLDYWNTQAQGTDAFSGHPLWIAEYNSAAEPELPRGWKDWNIWQYTSSLNVAGFQVDADRAKELV